MEKIVIYILDLNNLPVVLDFSEMEETGQYKIEFETDDFTVEEVAEAVEKLINSLLKESLSAEGELFDI